MWYGEYRGYMSSWGIIFTALMWLVVGVCLGLIYLLYWTWRGACYAGKGFVWCIRRVRHRYYIVC